MFKVSDFKPCNKPWGPYRRVIAEMPILDTPAIIMLFRENDNGQLSISVHGPDKRMLVKLGCYYVDGNAANQQKALDSIYNTLMWG